MDHITPSPNLHFDTFSTFTLPNVNESNSSIDQVAVAENFFRTLSEKIGRGLSRPSDSENTLDVTHDKAIFNGSANVSRFPNEEWIRQAEYDKFMNEIWIGIVLTLIVISLVFCICSCFLYHQFRQWKNNYHRNIQQNNDMESVKLNKEDDELPDYTLVSGLPSYDAAMEELKKLSKADSCVLMYPSVFRIFANDKNDSFESIPIQGLSQTAIQNSTATTSHELLTTAMTIPSYEDAVFGMCRSNSDAIAYSYQEILKSNITVSRHT